MWVVDPHAHKGKYISKNLDPCNDDDTSLSRRAASKEGGLPIQNTSSENMSLYQVYLDEIPSRPFVSFAAPSSVCSSQVAIVEIPRKIGQNPLENPKVST